MYGAPTTFSAPLVVKEAMIIQASRSGDLERLRPWARQGVRVTTAAPLIFAAEGGFLNVVIILVTELGADTNEEYDGPTALLCAAFRGNVDIVHRLVDLKADVNQAIKSTGETPLIVAAHNGKLDMVRCLLEGGARIGQTDHDGDTALLMSAMLPQYSTMQYLLEHTGANIEDVNNRGDTVWDVLAHHLTRTDDDEYRDGKDDVTLAALLSLLRVVSLRGALLSAVVAHLSPEPRRVVQEGARLWERLPAYLMRRRALLDAHRPLLLPPLRALVNGCMELTTTEDLWATGLGAAP